MNKKAAATGASTKSTVPETKDGKEVKENNMHV